MSLSITVSKSVYDFMMSDYGTMLLLIVTILVVPIILACTLDLLVSIVLGKSKSRLILSVGILSVILSQVLIHLESNIITISKVLVDTRVLIKYVLE